MRIFNDKFFSQQPLLAPHLLPEGFARDAINVKVQRGFLESFRSPTKLFDFPLAVTTLHQRKDGGWWTSGGFESSVVESPINLDPYDRLYYTNDSNASVAPQVHYDINGQTKTVDLGVPADGAAPTVSSLGNQHVIECWFPDIDYDPNSYPSFTDSGTNAYYFTRDEGDTTGTYMYVQLKNGFKHRLEDGDVVWFPEYVVDVDWPAEVEEPKATTTLGHLTRLTAGVPRSIEVVSDYVFKVNVGVKAWVANIDYTTQKLEGLVQYAQEDDLPEYRAYAFSLVNELGEEGAIGNLSGQVLVHDREHVQVTVPIAVYDSVKYPNITRRRIYRTVTSNGETSLFMIDDRLVGDTTTFIDALPFDELGPELDSLDWLPPPENLRQLTGLPNGVLAGFAGNEVCLCEPNLPHAWPSKFRYGFTETVKAIAPIPEGLFVFCQRANYLLLGTYPENMTRQVIPESITCASLRSIVQMGGITFFVSVDGIMGIRGGEVENLTDTNTITQEQWAAYNPSQIRATAHENLYYGTDGTKSFIFDPRTRTLTDLDLTPELDALYADASSGILYYASGTGLYKFDDAPTRLNYFWHSKEHFTPALSFAWAQLDVINAHDGVTFKLYKNDVLLHTQVISTAGITCFRLPPDCSTRWHFTLEGNADIRSLTIAEGSDEL